MKNNVFSKTRCSKLGWIWDAIWVPTWLHFASKIHQSPFKIHSQEAFKNWSILASIFERFGLRFGNQVGTMLPTCFAPRRPKTPPRRPQDAPTKLSRRPQRHQDALKRLQRGPKTPPRSILGRFFMDFRWIFDWFLTEFSLIFDYSFRVFFWNQGWKLGGLPRFCVRLIVQRSPAVLPLCGCIMLTWMFDCLA